MQVEYPLDEYVPAEQTTELVVQVEAPAVDEVPEAQLEQTEEDAVEVKVLARQDEQTVAEEAEYFPAAQLPVTADKPVVAQYDPVVHAEQLEEPAVP